MRKTKERPFKEVKEMIEMGKLFELSDEEVHHYNKKVSWIKRRMLPSQAKLCIRLIEDAAKYRDEVEKEARRKQAVDEKKKK